MVKQTLSKIFLKLPVMLWGTETAQPAQASGPFPGALHPIHIHHSIQPRQEQHQAPKETAHCNLFTQYN